VREKETIILMAEARLLGTVDSQMIFNAIKNHIIDKNLKPSIIIMYEIDFEKWLEREVKKVFNFYPSKPFRFQGIEVITSKDLNQGEIRIY